jgi:hypothetical protein
MIAQTDHDTKVVKILQLLEKLFRHHNILELNYKINDFIATFQEKGCRLMAAESVFFSGYKVLLFKKG